jgi:predicted metal-dependent phosphoesterase TrpH
MSEASSHTRRILLATPYPWSTPHPVNEHVADLADGLVALREAGHDVPSPVVVAPSSGGYARKTTRRALRELVRGADPAVLFAPGGDIDLSAAAPGMRRPREAAHDWPLVATALPVGPASVSLRAALRVLLDHGGFEAVHVHDPLANDLVRFIVRRWSGLTVATSHSLAPTGVAAVVAAPLRERIIDGVDRWLVADEAARAELTTTISDALDPVIVPVHETSTHVVGGRGAVIVVGRGEGDEAAVRDLVRDLTPLLDSRPELTLTLLSRWGSHHRPTTPRALRGRLLAVEAPTREQADVVLAGAGAYLALPGTHPRCRAEAVAANVPIVDAPTTGDEDSGDVEALHLRVAAAIDSAPTLVAPTPAASSGTALLAQAHVHEYDALRERVQVHIAAPTAGDRSCVIDLHMHTSHSWDCATDPEALLHVAREVGLTAVAVTDHNEISGALACAELADEYGIQVIVGEEVKTSQGEVIGLFLTERIEPGLTWHETIARIRAQDGLVYVPHPFDRLHTIPDVHLLRDTLDEIDAFETYNARLPFDQYNRDAERFARKYNLVEGAGSDAHVVQGLGTAAVHMPAWDDKESFLVALGQGEILKRPKSLLYLQGLKWVNDLTGRSKKLPAEAAGASADT